jgi:hypothetical protein
LRILTLDFRGLQRFVADKFDPQILLVVRANVLEGADELPGVAEKFGL